MANHSATKKSIRQTARRTEANRSRMSKIRSLIRKVEEAVEKKDQKVAATAFKNMQPELMRGVQKNLLHKNTAARKMSRLSAKIKAI